MKSGGLVSVCVREGGLGGGGGEGVIDLYTMNARPSRSISSVLYYILLLSFYCTLVMLMGILLLNINTVRATIYVQSFNLFIQVQH